MKWMVRNSSGKPDFVLTLTLIGFLVVIFKVLIAGGSFIISGNTYSFGEISAAEIGAILTPTLGAYVARRYTDRRYIEPAENGEEDAS